MEWSFRIAFRRLAWAVAGALSLVPLFSFLLWVWMFAELFRDFGEALAGP